MHIRWLETTKPFKGLQMHQLQNNKTSGKVLEKLVGKLE